jgi:drug/metabolite transporter (DMT)-like permease
MMTYIKRYLPHLALLAVAWIYGLNYIIAKDVMVEGYVQPYAFILLRVVSATLLFWLFFSSKVHKQFSRVEWGRLILCGLFGAAANQLFFFAGLEITGPINASLVITTNPVLVLFLSVLFFHHRVSWANILGIFLGLAGALLVITGGKFVSTIDHINIGDLYVFLNALSYALYLLIVKPLLIKYNPTHIITWVFTFGTLFVLPFGMEEISETPWHTFDLGIILSVVYVLFFTTFLAYLLNLWALSKVNVLVVSIFIYLQPIIAGTVSVLMGKDQLTLIKFGAGLLILAGILLVSLKKQGKKQS